MYKKTVTYKDFDGNDRTEDLYFHLTKAEVVKWLTTKGDYTLDKLLYRLADERNGKRIIEIFEELIQDAYGKKSLDGRNFVKSKEVKEEFIYSEAYSDVFMSIIGDDNEAAKFIVGIMPSDLAEAVEKAVKQSGIEESEKRKDSLLIMSPTNPNA